MHRSTSEDEYLLDRVIVTPSASATQNACKLCSPLGAALVFKGIRGAVPLLHGSQGCSTYIRRYLISHYKEPVDIACSNFVEQTAVFGGGYNLRLALDNVIQQYKPALVGIASTCLSETIGDDVSMIVKQYRRSRMSSPIPRIVHASTPSYRGTHMDGFHRAVQESVATLAVLPEEISENRINIFPGLLSPSDLRHLKDLATAFELKAMVLPDFSDTLDGGLWKGYQRIPPGGTPVEAICSAGSARATIELGHTLARTDHTAATILQHHFNVPALRIGLPIGVRATDELVVALAEISGRPVPSQFSEQRGRLLDTLVDGHKYVNTVRAAVYGEEDLVTGLVGFLAEIGIRPVVCASGGRSGHLAAAIRFHFPERQHKEITILEGADFATIETKVSQARPDLIIGHSKGYSMSRRLGIPLVRVGFPIHDRLGGPRILHVGYEGAMALFDRFVNALIEHRQQSSPVGYTYM